MENSKKDILISKVILIALIIISALFPFVNGNLINFSFDKKFEEVVSAETTNSSEETSNSTSDWNLVFEETFENLDNWKTVNQNVVHNNELQTYEKENVEIKDGKLILTGKSEGKFTSGKITSNFSLKYGKIEVKAKTNSKYGSFPAVWMSPTQGGKMPQINIFEHLGRENTAYAVNHFLENGSHSRSFKGTKIDSEYHTYTIEWSSKKIDWYIDGEHFHTSTKGVPQEDMYLIINLAIGGNNVGTPELNSDPMKFTVDSIKIYKK